MSNRGLTGLVLVLVLGLFTTPAFAQNSKKSPSQGQYTGRKTHKYHRVSPVSLSFYAQGSYYLVGSFFDPYNSDRLVRSGLGLGVGCYYRSHGLQLGTGWEFYDGSFKINHIEPGLNGSLYFEEIGVKPWVNAALNFGGVQIGLTAGLEKTKTSTLNVKDLYIDPGFGWLNLGMFASEQVLSKVDLKVWELALDARFQSSRHLSFTFGLLWQKYQGAMQIDFAMYGKEVLKFLNYDVDNVIKKVDISTNSFFLTPGVRWCGKHLCASLTIPWGVFGSDTWSLGGITGLEWTF